MSHNHSPSGHSHHSEVDGHNCPSHGANSQRLLIAAGLTGSFMIVEVIGGIFSGSLALLADAGHMVTDFTALIAAFIGVRIEERRAQGGHKSSLWPARIALGSGLSLLLIAGWIIYEAIKRMTDPAPVLAGPMLIIAGLGLVVNIAVFAVLMGGDRKSLNMRGAVLHVAGDMLGSLAAIIAALIILTTGYFPADPVLSVLVAAIISISALPLIRDSVSALRKP